MIDSDHSSLMNDVLKDFQRLNRGLFLKEIKMEELYNDESDTFVPFLSMNHKQVSREVDYLWSEGSRISSNKMRDALKVLPSYSGNRFSGIMMMSELGTAISYIVGGRCGIKEFCVEYKNNGDDVDFVFY